MSRLMCQRHSPARYPSFSMLPLPTSPHLFLSNCTVMRQTCTASKYKNLPSPPNDIHYESQAGHAKPIRTPLATACPCIPLMLSLRSRQSSTWHAAFSQPPCKHTCCSFATPPYNIKLHPLTILETSPPPLKSCEAMFGFYSSMVVLG
jgi:hypothetical protein